MAVALSSAARRSRIAGMPGCCFRHQLLQSVSFTGVGHASERVITHARCSYTPHGCALAPNGSGRCRGSHERSSPMLGVGELLGFFARVSVCGFGEAPRRQGYMLVFTTGQPSKPRYHPRLAANTVCVDATWQVAQCSPNTTNERKGTCRYQHGILGYQDAVQAV
jgi:hypothetical protein